MPLVTAMSILMRAQMNIGANVELTLIRCDFDPRVGNTFALNSVPVIPEKCVTFGYFIALKYIGPDEISPLSETPFAAGHKT